MITEKTINEIKDKIILLENPSKIILFGSYSKGEATEKSDLDLLVIKESKQPPSDRALDLRWELAHYPFETDLIMKTPEEFNQWQDVAISFNAKVKREGRILYERGGDSQLLT